MTTTHHSVCVIGAGPRGLSVIERLCAHARTLPADANLTIHVADPYPPGPGRVWRTDQSRQLLMNTVASQISVFTDPSVDLAGPLEPGPSLHQWATSLTTPARHDSGDATGDRDVPEHVLAEARRLGPDSYPTRAFYGRYLAWAYRHVLARAPQAVTLTWHPWTAIALNDDTDSTHDTGGGGGAAGPWPRQQVVLEDGSVLHDLDAVILCQGHLPADPDPDQDAFARQARQAGLTYIGPANPADLDLSLLPPGQGVLLRGLGLNFFDCMAQLTAGRGGTFTRRHGALVYHPSGNEPLLYAGSRRGIPYQARGHNEKGAHGRHEPLVFTARRVAALRRHNPGGLDFRTQLWPLIAREVETVYYRTILTSRGHVTRARTFQSEYLAAGFTHADTDPILSAYGFGEKYRLDWDLLARPYRDREFTGPGDFTTWLLDHLREDAADAAAGNVSSPLKAALDVLRDLRNEVRLAVDHSGLDGDSHRQDLDGWYTPLNAHLSIGPPASRVEELIALIDAGIVHIIGPGLTVTAGPDGYTAASPLVPGSTVRTRALIEARLPAITLARTRDRLLRHLLATGQCTAHRIPTRAGGAHVTDGLAVTARPFHLIDADGRPHPRRFAFGVPTESVHWVTAAGIRPGVNSVTLTDSDAIALAALTTQGHPHDR
jgi:FAD-NAD(P)-binding